MIMAWKNQKAGKWKLKFGGTRDSIKIVSFTFAVIIFMVAFDSLGWIEFPLINAIKTVLLLAGMIILIGETFFEDREHFKWNFPTIMASMTIIGVFMLAIATFLNIPPDTFLIGHLFANDFVVYLVLGIFLSLELFKIEMKERGRR